MPSFSAAADAERPLGITVRVGKNPGLPGRKAAPAQLGMQISPEGAVRLARLSDLRAASSPSLAGVTAWGYSQPVSLERLSAFCVSVE